MCLIGRSSFLIRIQRTLNSLSACIGLGFQLGINSIEPSNLKGNSKKPTLRGSSNKGISAVLYTEEMKKKSHIISHQSLFAKITPRSPFLNNTRV